jgi:hypothetical protein
MAVVDTNVNIVLFTVFIIRFVENEAKARKKAAPVIIKQLDSIDIEHNVNAM